MISPQFFISRLQNRGIDFFTGVPDSLLKSLCAYMKDNIDPRHNVTAANEGGAIALAAGHFLASGHPACIYMQNSGIGNSVNPLLSLLDEEVYHIPALLIIGWRGMPGTHDEPQHVKQGRVTTSLCDAMEIPYIIMADQESIAAEQIDHAINYIKETGRQIALIVRKNTFSPYDAISSAPLPYPIREDVIGEITDAISSDTAIVSTTGMISRELFELRDTRRQNHASDFLTVGSMGHASQIALGIALSDPDRNIVCLDGDGALLMHLGALPIIGKLAPKNFIHFVINNGAHDSVGGQDTVGLDIDIPAIALAAGYKTACTVKTIPEIRPAITAADKSPGPHLIEICVRKGARPDLGRPKSSPEENRKAFMEFLKQNQRH